MRTVPHLLAISVLAGPLSAQAPADRAALEALRSDLAAIDDSVALLEREARGIARARADRDNPLLHLELGFLAYRIGEITEAAQHYDDAASEFEWAADLEPSWPYPWYGLGLAELALGEHSVLAVENLRQALGLDYLTKAADAFARAAEADPAFARAVIDLAETAMRQRVNARLTVALGALRRSTMAGAEVAPPLHLAHGRVARIVGEGDSALAAFEQYLAAGGDSALGLLEAARTLFFLRRAPEAHQRYYAGAALVHGGAARALVRDDIAWIATAEDLQALDATPDETFATWLEEFWRRRAVADGRRPADRLPEHYRRYFYAMRHFALVSRHRRYDPVDAYRVDQSVLDDRGIIYLRQGEPDRRAVYTAIGVEPNESWLYERADGNLVFHFVARGDVQDYKLVESLLDVFGLETAVGLQAGGQVTAQAAALFESRATFDPVYQRLASGGSATAASALATERRRGREAVRLGTTTDTYPLRFERSLDPSVQVYALGRSEGSGGRLLVVFALPGRRLEERTVGAATAYPIVIRVAATHDDDGSITDLDTTRIFLTDHALQPEEHLAGYVELPVPAGALTVRAMIADGAGGAGDVIDVDSVRVPAFGGGTFQISDLVLGEAGSGLSWPSGRDTVPLNPLAAYAEDSNMELYYEVHGVPPGRAYRARVEVRGKRGTSIFARIGRLFGGGGPQVAFEFEGLSTGSVTRAVQTVELASLDEGEYRVELTIEDPQSEIRHTRVAPFRVTSK